MIDPEDPWQEEATEDWSDSFDDRDANDWEEYYDPGCE